MNKIRPISSLKAQTAVEYLLLLTIVIVIVLIGLKVYLPRTDLAAELYFNRVGVGILGNANPCGDGNCDDFEKSTRSCCVDCGGCGLDGSSSSSTVLNQQKAPLQDIENPQGQPFAWPGYQGN